MKKNIFLIIGGVVLFLFIVITSFMWYRLFYWKSPIDQAVTTLQVSLSKEDGSINETNAVPVSDADAKNVTPYIFSVKNTSSKAGIYKVLLEETALQDDVNHQSQNLLSRNQLAYQLLLNGTLIKKGMLSDLKNNILDERNIGANATNRYELKVYISESAVDTAWQNKFYYYKVVMQTEGK